MITISTFLGVFEAIILRFMLVLAGFLRLLPVILFSQKKAIHAATSKNELKYSSSESYKIYGVFFQTRVRNLASRISIAFSSALSSFPKNNWRHNVSAPQPVFNVISQL